MEDPVIIGVDVGGTNTDAVVLCKNQVITWTKQVTTTDVTTGVLNAVSAVLVECRKKCVSRPNVIKIQQINIGTTHFVNAVVQRSSSLVKVAVLRLAKPPCTNAIKPFSDFPTSLRKLVEGGFVLLNGGYEFDGREMSPVDEDEIVRSVKHFITFMGVNNFVVCGVFSSTKSDQEQKVGSIIKKYFPSTSFTCSYQLGQIGFLERENAAILNESLKHMCERTVGGLKVGMEKLGLTCPLYFTQNDGTICSIERALLYPVFTFASGPTNSMRGAAFVSGLKDAIVVDIGGTTTDIGVLVNGFPRLAGARVLVGEVPTNFRMPQTLSLGLGGGSVVKFNNGKENVTIGPESVGYLLEKYSLCFGGETMTTTDIAVVAGMVSAILPNDQCKTLISNENVKTVLEKIRAMINDGIDQMKTEAALIPVVFVGGGSVLVDCNKPFNGSNKTILVEHYSVANAIGAALSQVSGQVDVVISLDSPGFDRAKIIESTKLRAKQNAIDNGASKEFLEIAQFDEIPLTYLPGNAVRMQCRVVGPLNTEISMCSSCLKLDLQKFVPYENLLKPIEEDSLITNETDTQMIPVLDVSSDFPVDFNENPWTLNATDVELICIGAAVLGCGGGGNPHVGKLRLFNLLERGLHPTLVTVDWLLKNGFRNFPIFDVGMMGAPAILIEKLASGNESLNLISLQYAMFKNAEYLRNLPQQTIGECEISDNVPAPEDFTFNKRDFAVMTPEVGGVNSTEALAVSALFGVYCVDCDEMGRAFPELQMSTKLIYGCPPCPTVQANDQGRLSVTVSAKSHKGLENANRQICIENGCTSAFGLASIDVSQLKETCVLGSIRRAWSLGKVIKEAKLRKSSPIDAVIEAEGGKLICKGKLVDVARKIEAGFNKGFFVLEGLNEFAGSMFKVEFQNENLLIWREIECVAFVPDLICLMDTETGEAIPTEDLRYGLRASLIVLKPSPMLTTKEALNVVGPVAFGYKNLEYKSF